MVVPEGLVVEHTEVVGTEEAPMVVMALTAVIQGVEEPLEYLSA